MLDPKEYFEPLKPEEKNDEYIAIESKSFVRDVWERFCSSRRAMFGLIILGLVVLVAVVGPIISPYPYDGMDTSVSNQVDPLLTGLVQTRWGGMSLPVSFTEPGSA